MNWRASTGGRRRLRAGTSDSALFDLLLDVHDAAPTDPQPTGYWDLRQLVEVVQSPASAGELRGEAEAVAAFRTARQQAAAGARRGPRRSRRVRRTVIGVVLIGGSVTSVAAAAGGLPPVIGDIVDVITPFGDDHTGIEEPSPRPVDGPIGLIGMGSGSRGSEPTSAWPSNVSLAAPDPLDAGADDAAALASERAGGTDVSDVDNAATPPSAAAEPPAGEDPPTDTPAAPPVVATPAPAIDHRGAEDHEPATVSTTPAAEAPAQPPAPTPVVQQVEPGEDHDGEVVNVDTEDAPDVNEGHDESRRGHDDDVRNDHNDNDTVHGRAATPPAPAPGPVEPGSAQAPTHPAPQPRHPAASAPVPPEPGPPADDERGAASALTSALATAVAPVTGGRPTTEPPTPPAQT